MTSTVAGFVAGVEKLASAGPSLRFTLQKSPDRFALTVTLPVAGAL